jgi:hypothetical protein
VTWLCSPRARFRVHVSPQTTPGFPQIRRRFEGKPVPSLGAFRIGRAGEVGEDIELPVLVRGGRGWGVDATNGHPDPELPSTEAAVRHLSPKPPELVAYCPGCSAREFD